MSVQASDIEAPMMLLIALILLLCVVVELIRGIRR